MALTRDCQDRLVNFKFNNAVRYLDPELATEEEDTVVRALASVFGNVGGFDGDMSYIVAAAVSTLLTFPEFTDHHEPPVPGAHPLSRAAEDMGEIDSA